MLSASKQQKARALRALIAEGSGATDEERDTARRILEKLESRVAKKSVGQAKPSMVEDGWDLGVDSSSGRDRTEWCVVYVGHCPRCGKMVPIRLNEEDIRNEAPVGTDEKHWEEYLGRHAGKICKCPGGLTC